MSMNILDLALQYLLYMDLEKFWAPPSYSLWDLKKFRILPLYMGSGTWKNSELWLYTSFGIWKNDKFPLPSIIAC